MKKPCPHVLAAAIAMCAGAAHAQLVLSGPEDFQGTGLGAVNTVLTIQSPGNSTSESGSVAWIGTGDLKSGDFKSGASQTRTRTFAELGVMSAADLRVVFNALEPGNSANSIQLTGLTLGVYDSAGNLVFTSSTAQSYSFANTLTGAGNSGFVFALSAQDAAALQALFNESLRVGLSAQATNATGGFETFFVANAPVTIAIPEPASYALTLAGMGIVGLVARRRGQRT